MKDGKVKSVYLGSDLKKAKAKLKILKQETSKDVEKRSSATLKKSLNPRRVHKLSRHDQIKFHDRIFLSFVLVVMLAGFMFFGGIIGIVSDSGAISGFAVDFNVFSEGGNHLTGNAVLGGNKITGDAIFFDKKETLYGEHNLKSIIDVSQEYTLTVSGIERLDSLKVSGEFVSLDDGSAKVFLSDINSGDTYLVYESETEEDFEAPSITGNVIFEEEAIEPLNYKEIGNLLEDFGVLNSRGENVIYNYLNSTNESFILGLGDFLEIKYPEKGGWLAYEEYSARGLIEPVNISFEKVFGFDFSGLNFSKFNESNLTLSSTAEGEYLYGCSLWDFEYGICLTNWEYLLDINISENYTINLTNEIVAFAEGVFEIKKEDVEDVEEEIEIVEEEVKEDLLKDYLESLNISNHTIEEFENVCEDACRLRNAIGREYIIKFYIQDSVLGLESLEIGYGPLEGANYSIELRDSDGFNVLIIEDDFEDNDSSKSNTSSEEEAGDVVDKGSYTEEVIQYGAVIGEPVQWKKKIVLGSEQSNVEFDMPEEAGNISLKKILNGRQGEIESAELDEGNGTIIELGVGSDSFIDQLVNRITGNAITGMAVADSLKEQVNDTILVNDKVDEIIVEYETPAPTIQIETLNNGMKIILGSVVEYKDVLSFANIPESDLKDIYLFNLQGKNDTKRVKINFTGHDTNEDGKIDYIEWIVPVLGNETYELLISSVTVEHRDKTDRYISNLEATTIAQDGVYGSKIHHGEYLRVVFEGNLTGENSIGMYLRNVQESKNLFEIYTSDLKNKIMDSSLIIGEGYYSLNLDGFNGSSNEFNLKVMNKNLIDDAYLEWDLIEDPIFENGFNVTVMESVEDGRGVLVNVFLEVKSDTGDLIYGRNGTVHNLSVVPGMYDIIYKPSSGKIKQVIFDDYNVASPINQLVDLDESFELEEFQKTYAINPKTENFTNATVTVVATADTLYKCQEWNYTEQSCGGSWKLLKTGLTPGEEYNITLYPNDPGFGEINISAAQHLDENYSFISDVYNESRYLDGNWTEFINHTEIIRAEFIQNLTANHHVKIYVRNVQGANTRVEVYVANTTSLVATFPIIDSEGYYKAYLTDMVGMNDTFDLKVINEDGLTEKYLEFDHITDPNEVSNVTLESPVNNSHFDAGTAGVELQVRVEDDLLPVDNVTLSIYGASNANPSLHDLLYKFNVSNGTQITYNWSKYPFDIVADTQYGFHFDEVLGVGETPNLVLDWAGNKNGTPAGNAVVNFSNDVFGGHYEFDGTGDWLHLGTGYTEIQHGWNLTWMGWVKSNDLSQNGFIASQGVYDPTLAPGKYVGWFIGQKSGAITVIQGNGAAEKNTDTAGFFDTAGEWNHVALTKYKNGSYTLYKNGIVIDTYENAQAMYTAAILSHRLAAGASTGGGNPVPWDGGLDDVILINRTLTGSEINDTLKLTSATHYWNASGDDSELVNNSELFNFGLGILSNTAPKITLNAPANTTNFTDTGEILLNSTVYDSTDSLTFVTIYGSSGQSKSDVAYSDMLYQNQSWQNNTDLTYNWTAPVLVPDGNYLLLAHFDNNTKYGENSTRVFDFADADGVQNGTIESNARINKSGGKLGGTFFSKATSDTSRVNFGDQDDWMRNNNISYAFWVKPRFIGNTRGIFDKRASSNGFAIRMVSDELRLKLGTTTTILDGAFEIDTWTHIVVSFNESDQVSVYRNGIFNTSYTFVPFTENNIGDVYIGTGRNDFDTAAYPFNGSIDEFAILNKSLNASEVLDMYRLKAGDHSWFIEAYDHDDEESISDLLNESESWMFTVDRKPEISDLSIGPTGVNRTTGINCTFTATDDVDGTVDLTIKYYNQTTLFATNSPTGIPSGYPYTDNLSAFTYNHFENYSCNVTATDSRSSVSDQVDSDYIFIENYEPGTAILNTPINTTTHTNRTPTFNWTPANEFARLPAVGNSSCVSEGEFFCQDRTSDPDQDQVDYDINISCFLVGGGSCDDARTYTVEENSTNCDANANGYLDNEDNCTFTLPTDLIYFYDDNRYYEWTVKTSDPYVTEENVPDTFYYNLSVYVALDILDQVVDFGLLGLGVRSETSGCDLATQTPTPCPIWIENSGNVDADVNITGPSVAFWTTQSLPHSIDYFSVKVGDGTEGTSFDAADSNITYRIMPASGADEKFINNLSKDDASDEARIDFNISVPDEEIVGAKGMVLELTTWYGEVGGG